MTSFKMTEEVQFILNCLSRHYLIEADEITQLLLGADVNASIYKVQSKDKKTYFLKLKRGHFSNTSILELLESAGIQQLIHPVKTAAGNQILQANDYTLIVYPFIEGQDGFTRELSDQQWIALGSAIKQVHEVNIPTPLKTRIRREEFSPKWRDIVRDLYIHIERANTDEIASNLWKFLQENKSLIQTLVDRAEDLGKKALSHPLKYVLCHSDIHAGNVLVDGAKAFYIVDWDDPILAPKERDLMFIGGGVGNVWNKPHEEKLFYQGYGQAEIDKTLLAYYRYERIVEDIGIYSQEILLKPIQNNHRLVMYEQFMSQFEPNGVVDIAIATD